LQLKKNLSVPSHTGNKDLNSSSKSNDMEKEILDKYMKAGKIAAEVLQKSREITKPGVNIFELGERLEGMIKDKGGDMAFPVNISINDIAAHYTPIKNDEITIKKEDVVKVDVGVHVDGYIGDTACTIIFDDKHKELVKASEDALNNSIAVCKPGALLSDVSKAIEDAIKSLGFNPISNLTGHGLEKHNLHADPKIPNVEFTGDYKLKEDQVIAIEPFATDGDGMVKESTEMLIFMLVDRKPTRNFDARKIMDFVEQFNGLPFAERWLLSDEAKKFGLPDSRFKIRIALKELRERGAIYDYPMLKETAAGLISQAEHTIIVKDEPIVTTKL